MATISRGLGFLPLSLSFLLVSAMILSYIIAILEHDVEPVLPSVSKTAAFQPQGSIFNQFLDTIAFLGLVTIFLRFLQVEMATTGVRQSHITGLISRLRIASLTFGIGCMVGVTIAGNFRFPSGEVRLINIIFFQHYVLKAEIFAREKPVGAKFSLALVEPCQFCTAVIEFKRTQVFTRAVSMSN